MKLDLYISDRGVLKKILKDGFIYQRFQHSCGYVGNSYYKVESHWVWRTNCPQCGEELKEVSLEKVMPPMIPKLEVPRFVFQEEPT